MDEDLRELAMILARNSAPKESSLTVRWVAVIGIFTIICGYLFVGHNTNASQISKLDARIEAREEYNTKAISKFEWQEDRIGDWTPWVITMAYNAMTDDCDGAANLAKWWFKQNGVEAEILNLYSDKEGHAVCVTKNRTKMVTNERVVNLNPTCWEKEMLDYFGNKYTVII